MRTLFWILCSLLLLVRVPSLVQPAGADQGLYAYIGERILAGEVPYRDAWDQKPPGIHFTYALLYAVHPDLSVVPAADLIVAAASAWLILLLGRRMGPPGTGEVAALLFLLYTNPALARLGGARIRTQCEVFIALFATAGLWLTHGAGQRYAIAWDRASRAAAAVRGDERRTGAAGGGTMSALTLALAAGLCFGAAFIYKYNAGIYLIVGLAGAWLWTREHWSRPGTRTTPAVSSSSPRNTPDAWDLPLANHDTPTAHARTDEQADPLDEFRSARDAEEDPTVQLTAPAHAAPARTTLATPAEDAHRAPDDTGPILAPPRRRLTPGALAAHAQQSPVRATTHAPSSQASGQPSGQTSAQQTSLDPTAPDQASPDRSSPEQTAPEETARHRPPASVIGTRRRPTLVTLAPLFLWTIVGFAAMFALLLGYFAAHGALRDLYDATIAYNLFYSGETYTSRLDMLRYLITFPVQHARVEALWFLGGLGSLVLLATSFKQPARLILPLWIGAACISIAVNGGRGLPQYFLQAGPALALAAAMAAVIVWQRTHVLLRVALCLLVAIGAWRVQDFSKAVDYTTHDLRYINGALSREDYLARFGGRASDDKYSALAVEELARYLSANVPANEHVLHFGFSQGALAQSHRVSATRFFWSRPIIVGFKADEPGYGPQGLLAEFARTRPYEVILQRRDWDPDTLDSATYFLHEPTLAAWLHANYAPGREMGNFLLYRRADAAASDEESGAKAR